MRHSNEIPFRVTLTFFAVFVLASATKFKARRDTRAVEGVVCCGLVLTGCNIRVTGGSAR